MTFDPSSLDWAIDFISNHSDSDLFPRIPEFEAVVARKSDFIQEVQGKPCTQFAPGPSRRYIIPKDEISYRQATQLDPQDSILLSALVHKHGQGIEDRRLPPDRVFSYRFSPSPQGGLYAGGNPWNQFWTGAKQRAQHYSYVVHCDIADFYNQIYHHTVENQLIESSWPNQAAKWVISLLEATTSGVSRGVPIGPHGIHLIAEATLIPVDNSMENAGITFVRYVDDILIFCSLERQAQLYIERLATILDKQQRLMLQKHKTRIMNREQFTHYADEMILDRPISQKETSLLQLIRRYSGGDPYKSISFNQIAPEDWMKISNDKIGEIISEYINSGKVEYDRLNWFYRRLAQIGHPGAVKTSVENMALLRPCFAPICLYLASVQSLPPESWVSVGEDLLQILDSEEVQNNEFFRLSVLSLFARNKALNHFTTLSSKFKQGDADVKREILLAAKVNQAADWLREHKEDFPRLGSWEKLAFLYSSSVLPTDEKKYFLNRFKFDRPFEKVLVSFAKSN